MLKLLGIAIAMSIDAFSVSVCVGTKYNKPSQTLRIVAAFGFFQFIMPLIGAYFGLTLSKYTSKVAYLAAAVLIVIAVKMLMDSFKSEDCKVYTNDPTKGLQLLILAIATSIDALGAGMSLILIGNSILFSSVVIGVVCGLFSYTGVLIGKNAKTFLGHYAEKLGALILLIIAITFIW